MQPSFTLVVYSRLPVKIELTYLFYRCFIALALTKKSVTTKIRQKTTQKYHACAEIDDDYILG
ncbi:hypothetical protein FB480_104116 [Agrobacterium vitis]|nr:hypothetical protein FB480_104116 [Agrobacterium vitis]